MRQFLYVVVFIVMFIVCGIWLSDVLDFKGRRYYSIDGTWAEDTGVLVQLDHGKYSGSKFKYIYNGRQYLGYSHLNYNPLNAVIGDRLVLKINRQFPDKYTPIGWK